MHYKEPMPCLIKQYSYLVSPKSLTYDITSKNSSSFYHSITRRFFLWCQKWSSWLDWAKQQSAFQKRRTFIYGSHLIKQADYCSRRIRGTKRALPNSSNQEAHVISLRPSYLQYILNKFWNQTILLKEMHTVTD